MSETPNEKLTVADLVKAQRDTAEQLRVLNEHLTHIDESTRALATTDFKAVNPVLDVFFFVALAIGSVVTQSFVGFELAMLVYIGLRLLYRSPAIARVKEMALDEKEARATREADAKEWERFFGKKKVKPLTPPSA